MDRVNVSLDTLRPEVFRKLARRDRLPDVLDGLAAAAEAGLAPVKVNAVLMRDLNDDEAVPLLRFCLDHSYELRFIEQMPLDAQHWWNRAAMVTAEQILAALGREFSLTPDDPNQRGSAPAEAFAGQRRPGPGRCDRVGHPAVLRDLRPGPADRGRPGPELPVRPDRERPARRDAVRGERRRAGGPVGAGGGGEASRPRHQRPVVPAADRPMSAIGG